MQRRHGREQTRKDQRSGETGIVVPNRVACAWWQIAVLVRLEGLVARREGEEDGLGGDCNVAVCNAINNDGLGGGVISSWCRGGGYFFHFGGLSLGQLY